MSACCTTLIIITGEWYLGYFLSVHMALNMNDDNCIQRKLFENTFTDSSLLIPTHFICVHDTRVLFCQINFSVKSWAEQRQSGIN